MVAVTTLPCGPAAALILEYVEMTTMTPDEERKVGGAPVSGKQGKCWRWLQHCQRFCAICFAN